MAKGTVGKSFQGAAWLWILMAVWSGSAQARSFVQIPGGQSEAETFTPMLGVSGDYGLEVGVKADWLIASPGFIPFLNNAVFLEGSLFLSERHLLVSPLMRWDFNVHPQWTVYGEGGVNINLRLSDDDESNTRKRPVYVAGLVGAIWRVPGKSWVLRGEVDLSDDSVRVGPSLPL